jgi:hypothetical protein
MNETGSHAGRIASAMSSGIALCAKSFPIRLDAASSVAG